DLETNENYIKNNKSNLDDNFWENLFTLNEDELDLLDDDNELNLLNEDNELDLLDEDNELDLLNEDEDMELESNKLDEIQKY
ncbi:15476_t:CDS:2, partial [Racocetra fulgida]